MKFLYGKSWEKYPIQENETWFGGRDNSCLTVCDIRDYIPAHMLLADMIYCDPPWDQGNANSFLTKADKDSYIDDFQQFYNPLFRRISMVSPKICYLEIGKRNLIKFQEKLAERFPVIQTWEVTYFKKHPCYLLRGGRHPQNYDFNGMDEAVIPEIAIRVENPECVADLCTGRGLTAVAAYKLKKRFVGTELNKRRLAVAIERINKIGGKYAPGLVPEGYFCIKTR